MKKASSKCQCPLCEKMIGRSGMVPHLILSHEKTKTEAMEIYRPLKAKKKEKKKKMTHNEAILVALKEIANLQDDVKDLEERIRDLEN